MSRIAKKPVIIPSGVEVTLSDVTLKVKGPKGTIQMSVPPEVTIKEEDKQLTFHVAKDVETKAIVGTTRVLVNNMIIGVTKGFERKLLLVGVGFKAQAQGKVLNLALGFSHAVKFPIPSDITIETPSVTEIIVRGIDKRLVGQVAAEIRLFRAPEPYKGKGVRYEGEVIVKKEGKKK